ncbi:MAG: 50S ribosomal protein L10 [Candidatus Electryonea clarkiae]|nr:50S ribosomal protein L10 [Candidatus Electryonea clarkiae]MDP8288930.1 50S ribosomal protein L10 [Candidatus Electryonea clarkiae]
MSYDTKANPVKKENVKKLQETISKAEGIIFTDFTGLSVADINDLRARFYEAGEVDYIVAKNTLTRIALVNKGYEDKIAEIDDSLRGPTGLAMGYEDAISPVKIIADFAKKFNGRPAFKGGIVDGDYINAEDIAKFKDIPPIDQLMGMVLGSMVSPLAGFVGTLNEIVRSFVGVIDAIIEKKKLEEGAEA